MDGLSDANRYVRRVVDTWSVGWEWIAGWCATAFLAAGGLLLATAVVEALSAVTSTSPPGIATGVTGFSGVSLTYVGLLGVYPRVIDRAPRFARAGVAFVTLPVVAIFVLTVWGVVGHKTSAVPVPIAVIPIGVVFMAAFLLFVLGTTFFGVASLRGDRLPRTVGRLLVALAATWVVPLVAGLAYGTRFPVWFDVAHFGVLSLITGAIGYRLRFVHTDRAGQFSESVR